MPLLKAAFALQNSFSLIIFRSGSFVVSLHNPSLVVTVDLYHYYLMLTIILLGGHVGEYFGMIETCFFQ